MRFLPRNLRTALVMIAALLCAALISGNAGASTLVPSQVPLPGDDLFAGYAFTQPLPFFGPGDRAALPRVNAAHHPFLKVTMKEIDQQVLPTSVAGPTRVWVYETSNAFTGKVLGPGHWPAVTVENQRFIPTTIKYVNRLPSFNKANPFGPGLVQGLVTVDQTIHWADPLHTMMTCMDNPGGGPECGQPYTGPVPAVAHLHGGETPSAFDGGPEQWFTPNGLKGKDYFSLLPAGPGEAIYRYDNTQEPGTPWFHDHALGATRTNVYSGLAAFYFIRSHATEPRDLPSGNYEIEMAIQDRQFDTQGQLFWPDGSNNGVGNLNGPPPNPTIHPFWIPEFVGDVVVVNGTPWPVLQVEPRRYLFRIVDGSNARFYNLSFGGLPVYQIGADDAYFDRPTGALQNLTLAPGERAYIIIDFANFAGQTIDVTNDAPIPFPMGLMPGDPGQLGLAKIMRFTVTLPLVKADDSCDPAHGECRRPVPMVRLTDGNGNLAKGVKIDRKRQLILKEVQGDNGPIEVLVNNTKWEGTRSANIKKFFPADGVSELPRVGSTELWEIINLTMDAHPMHTHLTQFQILSRQLFKSDVEAVDPTSYQFAWSRAFGTNPNSAPLPAGCSINQFCPGYGPPLPYNSPNTDGAVGGNPAIGPFLLGSPQPPDETEAGWKDTARVLPGQVMRIVVRYTPTSTPKFLAKTGFNLYPFDPTKGPGYVWHCHIVDHEDNEMMRPFKVKK